MIILDKETKKLYNMVITGMLIIFAGAFFVSNILGITYVKGNSMYPTLKSGQIVIVADKNIDNIQAGDIVVFKRNINEIINKTYIKRVVAVPGDTCVIKNGRLYVNGTVVIDNFPEMKDAGIAKEEIILSTNEYFVLGDNRNASTDSRTFGTITKDNIIGIAKLI